MATSGSAGELLLIAHYWIFVRLTERARPPKAF